MTEEFETGSAQPFTDDCQRRQHLSNGGIPAGRVGHKTLNLQASATVVHQPVRLAENIKRVVDRFEERRRTRNMN
jgi:hypothetical protein